MLFISHIYYINLYNIETTLYSLHRCSRVKTNHPTVIRCASAGTCCEAICQHMENEGLLEVRGWECLPELTSMLQQSIMNDLYCYSMLLVLYNNYNATIYVTWLLITCVSIHNIDSYGLRTQDHFLVSNRALKVSMRANCQAEMCCWTKVSRLQRWVWDGRSAWGWPGWNATKLHQTT